VRIKMIRTRVRKEIEIERESEEIENGK